MDRVQVGNRRADRTGTSSGGVVLAPIHEGRLDQKRELLRSRARPGRGRSAGPVPESWGVLQVRYRFFNTAFPDAVQSTAFNADSAYAVWRACYEGYESWLSDYAARGHAYKAGDAWGCIGRWYSGRWYDDPAKRYIDCIQRIAEGRRACPDA